MAYTILVCDDDVEIVEALEIYLSQEGYQVLKAYNGKQAMQILQQQKVHLVLLDLMMPEMDGLETLKMLRKEKQIPVIVLSAKSENLDKIELLEAGADDYVTKPFDMLEVLARVHSQLRRYVQYKDVLPGAGEEIYQEGGLLVNVTKKLVFMDGKLIDLTPLEFRILCLLAKNPGRVFSSEEIYESVWQEDSLGAVQTVAVHIRHIREKIEISPSEPRYLKVVWGLGYKLEPQRNHE